MSKLAKCPACDSDFLIPAQVIYWNDVYQRRETFYAVRCGPTACLMTGPAANNLQEAIDKWNELPRKAEGAQ